ncbi:MAG TPA: MATE family efflux transporter [Bacteroidetes bacterium]|nr:MATE family efflux transporter [Bacteroidota bacterium]
MGPSGSPLKDILKTSLPAVVDLSSQTIMWTIEAIMIGHLSAAAFAGVGMAIQIIILFFAVLLTFVVGSSVIINRHLGAGENWEANHVLGQALMVGIVMSIIIALIWFFGATSLFKLIRENEAVAQKSGVQYLRIISYFAPLILTNFIAMGILRAAGDTRITMYVNLLINSINLFLAATLIFGLLGFPRLEVRGAALAAGIAHSVGFFVTLYVLRSRKASLFLSFRELTTPNLKTFERLFKTGLPTTVEQLFWAFGQMVMTGYAAVLGIVYLAAHQVFMRIQAVLSMFFMGFSLGAMTLVGQNIGADEHKRAEQTGRIAGYVVLVFVLIVVASIFLFSRPLITLFTSDEKVVETGAGILRLFAFIQIPKALNAVLGGNLRGAGDLKWLMYLAMFSVIVNESFLSWVAAFPLGLSLWGIWLVMAIDEVFRAVLSYWRFHQGHWKSIKI